MVKVFSNVNNVFQPKNTLFTDRSSAQTARFKLTSGASLGLKRPYFTAKFLSVDFFSEIPLSIPHITVTDKEGIVLKCTKWPF